MDHRLALLLRVDDGDQNELGAIDNTSSSTPQTIYIGGGNTSGNPNTLANETSVAVDTAAGLVFSVGIGNGGSYDAFSVHNLNTGALIETVEFGPNTGSANNDTYVIAYKTMEAVASNWLASCSSFRRRTCSGTCARPTARA